MNKPFLLRFSVTAILLLSLLWLCVGCATAQRAETMPIETISLPQSITIPSISTDDGVSVPILLYHHITEEPSSNSISTARFSEHLQVLTDNGYTTVSLTQLLEFVEYGIALPDKPVVITFDDGYRSNLTLAAPILRQFGMNATVFVIGISIGKDTYKDTGVGMTPHFALEEALAYSDVIWIESHGYDIHQVEGRDPEPMRQGILPMEDESEDDYRTFLKGDCNTMKSLFQTSYNRAPMALAYPYGMFSPLSEEILKANDICITLTTRPHMNVLIPGQSECLYLLGRFSVGEDITPEKLLTILETGNLPDPEPVPATEAQT